MSHALHILKHEHRVIEKVLRALDGVCLRLQWGERVPLKVLSEIVSFITMFADEYHHGKEERLLFPALEEIGIQREGGPLAVMEREHRIERDLTDEMSAAAHRFQESNDEARRHFIDAARLYVDHLSAHIQKEDAILLRIAEEVLDEEAKRELAEAFKMAQTELGSDKLERLEALAIELDRAWSV